MKTKRVGAMALLLVLVLSLAGCGKSLEKQLPGSWYQKGENEPIFTLYDDGTMNAFNETEYGTWAVVNDDQLKIAGSYGAVTWTIESLKNGCMKLSDSYGNSETIWNTPQGK